MKIRSLLATLVVGVLPLAAQESVTPVTAFAFVRTEGGFVRGQHSGEVDKFLGIPYAAAPVGELRWKPPVPPKPWDGVREATEAGSECTQLKTVRGQGRVVVGSEDCLYLNVYRPANTQRTELLPVLIFIHGGLNHRESGNDYDPSEIVAKSKIIVVTLNYRLNVFGFLALPSLDREAGDPSSGNFGLLDQQAAMRWVQENIIAFGGNPHKVAAEGESAGGIDLCAHLTSPGSAGLFDKVILESMYCPAASHEEALATSAPVAVAAGCTELRTAVACLRAKSAADILQAAEPLNPVVGGATAIPGKDSGFNASPNYGNRVLPVNPVDALTSGTWNWSSILLGSNHDEAALFVAPALARKGELPMSVEGYERVVGYQFGSFAQTVLNEYNLADYKSPFMAYADEVTDDSPLGCALSPLSRSLSNFAPVYRYEFNDATAPTPFAGTPSSRLTLGAYHGSELQYLFKMIQLPGPQTPAQRALSEQMIRYWTNFVKTGDPNGPGLLEWPRYDPSTHEILSFRPAGNTLISNFDEDHHCTFWATAPGPPFK
jgi:para-nitrobenzyl esterase